MPSIHRRSNGHCTRMVLLSGLLAWPMMGAAQEASPEELVDMLKGGGYVIYMRHAQTESDYADQVTADPANCATQRVLSEHGWAQAKSIGSAIERSNIPVAEVISSEYCRAWQTADLAFDAYRKESDLNFEPAEEFTDVQMETMRNRVTPLITAPVALGKNRVIVGHDDPFEAVTGIYPEPQGVSFVLKVDDSGAISVVGSVAPDAWPEN